MRRPETAKPLPKLPSNEQTNIKHEPKGESNNQDDKFLGMILITRIASLPLVPFGLCCDWVNRLIGDVHQDVFECRDQVKRYLV